MKFEIQAFTLQDMPFIQHLQPQGWNDITLSFMEYCMHSFCMPVKVVDHNRIVGIGAVVFHEHSAWLGHIIVHETCRGQGLGSFIVEYLVALATKHGSVSINLIATDLGAPVYKKAGFSIVTPYQSLKRSHPSIPLLIAPEIKVASAAHYEKILQLDQEITRENRKRLIEAHVSRAIIYEEEGQLQGYYLPELGQGPIYAVRDAAGIALMQLKYTTVDQAVLPIDNQVAIAGLLKMGFKPDDFTAIRMSYGKELAWKPNQVFSRIGGNYG